MQSYLSAHWKLSPQPPHLNRACGSAGVTCACLGGRGGARGGAAHEQAGSEPAAHARATDHASAAADIAYTYACSRVPDYDKNVKRDGNYNVEGYIYGLIIPTAN